MIAFKIKPMPILRMVVMSLLIALSAGINESHAQFTQQCIASGSVELTAFGITFEEDNANTGHVTRTGGKKYAGYSGAIAGSTGASELLLFQKEIYGGKDANNPPAIYNIPVDAGGLYQVELYFAEVYHSAPNGRVFDVLLEGEVILDEYAQAVRDFPQTNAKFEKDLESYMESLAKLIYRISQEGNT